MFALTGPAGGRGGEEGGCGDDVATLVSSAAAGVRSDVTFSTGSVSRGALVTCPLVTRLVATDTVPGFWLKSSDCTVPEGDRLVTTAETEATWPFRLPLPDPGGALRSFPAELEPGPEPASRRSG